MRSLDGMRSTPYLRRFALLLVLVACTGIGAWTVPRVAGPRDYATSVADVQVRVSITAPRHRGVNLYVPLADWGLRADVTRAPVRVALEPRRINRAGVVRAVSGRTVAGLRAEVDLALRSAARRFFLLSVLGGLLGGLVALLIWHLIGLRGRRLLLAPALAAIATAVTVGGLIAWTTATFDATRLERPEYYASGIELERILAQADSLRRSGRKYSDRVDNAVRGITGLLNERGTGDNPLAPEGPGGAGDPAIRVALGSDIHNNLFTLPTLRRYAKGRLTVLAGDFTINGGRAEAPLLGRMATVGDPTVAVSGNHDSPGIMRALGRRGVTVLTHADGVRTIAGLTLAGFEDPLMFGAGEFPRGLRAGISFGDIPNGHERFMAAVEERWRWWQALPERPDVLIVHQAAIGRELAARIRDAAPEAPPVAILVGHTHRQRLDRFGPVTVVDAGSVGAGGLFGIGDQDVGLSLLDFGADGSLEATDLVSLDPSTSAARARRVITDSPDCDGTLVFCHDQPAAP